MLALLCFLEAHHLENNLDSERRRVGMLRQRSVPSDLHANETRSTYIQQKGAPNRCI